MYIHSQEPSPQTANLTPSGRCPASVIDKLDRLRSDLSEAWERLESLELLLREECQNSEADCGRLPAESCVTPPDPPHEAESEPAENAERQSCVEPAMHTLQILAENGVAEKDASSKDELAIRDYMERLLQRVGRGTASRVQSAVVEQLLDDADNVDDAPCEDESTATATAGEAQASTQGPDDESAEFSPSLDRHGFDDSRETAEACPSVMHSDRAVQAPTDLRAMRTLANVAAKTMIMEFDRKQHARLAIDKLLVMLVCLPCGMLLLYWYSVHKLGVAYIAASIAFFAVAIWGVQSLRFMGKLLIARLVLARLWRDAGSRE